MRWVRPEARALLTADDHTPTARAIAVLEKEVNASRRLLGGTAALGALLLAGLAAYLAGALTETGGDGPAALLFGLLALALGGLAAWIGLSVISAGRAVVRAYVAWSRRDSGLATRPADVIERGVAGPWIVREVLGALSLIATMFAAAVLVLPLVEGAIEDFVLVGLTLGGAGLVGFGTAAWCLLAGDFRAVWAHGNRVSRGYQALRRSRS